MSRNIVNVALGGRLAASQDQCRKIAGPSDFALQWFDGFWHGRQSALPELKKHDEWLGQSRRGSPSQIVPQAFVERVA
jgi:hypothetical protein